MAIQQLFEQRVIPAVVRPPPAHHLQPQGFPLSGRTVNLGLRFAAHRARHPPRPRRAAALPLGQLQQALPGQVLDQPPAFQILQPAAGPLPLQQFTHRARNLGDAQAGKIGGDLTDQIQIGSGELAASKGQWLRGRRIHRLCFGLPQ
jgi:hypothetical protein